jgi:hypothetical protein
MLGPRRCFGCHEVRNGVTGAGLVSANPSIRRPASDAQCSSSLSPFRFRLLFPQSWGRCGCPRSRLLVVALLLLLLLLLGLEGRKVYVPVEDDLEDDADEDDEEDGEEVGLVVEDGDGLGGRADGAEPVELAHCDGNSVSWPGLCLVEVDRRNEAWSG